VTSNEIQKVKWGTGLRNRQNKKGGLQRKKKVSRRQDRRWRKKKDGSRVGLGGVVLYHRWGVGRMILKKRKVAASEKISPLLKGRRA